MSKFEGRIEVICGPMFSSKTETLISRITRLKYANKTFKVFKPSIDNRYSESEIVSHAGLREQSIPVKDSQDILNFLYSKMVKLPDVVIIDEVQFFDKGIVKTITELANMGVSVIAAGLDQDFRGEPFEITASLLALAETVTKLTAVCVVCGNDATRSQRLVDGKPADYNDNIVLVGAKESYEARCREHHIVEEPSNGTETT